MSCGRRTDARVAALLRDLWRIERETRRSAQTGGRVRSNLQVAQEFLEAAQTTCRNLERDIQHAKGEATHNATRAAHLIRAARQIVERGR
jgi:hypothetical protein